MTDVLIERRNLDTHTTHTHTHTEHHVKMKAEVRGRLLQTKECGRLTAEAGGGGVRTRTDSPPQPSEGTSPADTLISDFQLPEP